jgi:hypothetical protein
MTIPGLGYLDGNADSAVCRVGKVSATLVLTDSTDQRRHQNRTAAMAGRNARRVTIKFWRLNITYGASESTRTACAERFESKPKIDGSEVAGATLLCAGMSNVGALRRRGAR